MLLESLGPCFPDEAAGVIRLSSSSWVGLKFEVSELRGILFQGQYLAFQLSKAFPDSS
jgi:hypothetical protein